MTQQVGAVRAQSDDQTAKTRIREAALDLFAERGIDATPMRAIASRAGVTVGLIVHHYGTKEALREAVELLIVTRFAEAIESVPLEGRAPEELVEARNEAVARMLGDNRAVVDYLRRALLDNRGERGDLVSRLSRLSAEQVLELRAAGVVSTKPAVGEQVMTIMVRQLGRLFLQPLVDRIGEEFAEELGDSPRHQLVVTVTH